MVFTCVNLRSAEVLPFFIISKEARNLLCSKGAKIPENHDFSISRNETMRLKKAGKNNLDKS